MRLLTRRYEKGRLVTRFCGIPVKKQSRVELTENEKALRREFLSMADIAEMPPAHGAARDVQLAGLVLLREVMRISDAEGFHPWTIAGTLLGMVRQKGRFIPWDDDVDLGIIREEYVKFVEVFNAKARPGFSARYRYHRKWCQIKISHVDLPEDVTMSLLPFDRYVRPLPTLQEKHDLFLRVKAEQARLDRELPADISDADHQAAFDDSRIRVLNGGMPSAPAEEHPAIYRSVEFSVAGWVKETAYDYDDIFPLRRGVFEGVEINTPNDAEMAAILNYGDYADWPGLLRPHHPASRFNMGKAIALRKFVRQHAQ